MMVADDVRTVPATGGPVTIERDTKQPASGDAGV